MNIRVGRRFAAVLAIAMLWFQGARANDYDESLLHDLSNNGLLPTDFVLGYSAAPSALVPAGSNFLIGTMGATLTKTDRDYVHLVIPEHYALVALRVEPTTTVAGSYSFVGIAAGKKISIVPTAVTAVGLLGWKLFSAGENGKAVDIFADMRDMGLKPQSVSRGAVWSPPKPCPLQGNKACLAAGDYTLWLQETAVSSVHYKFDLILAPVPEAPPAALWLAGLAVFGGFGRRWKKQRGESR
jgi:hypothetical protein